MLATVRNRCGVIAGVEPYEAGPRGPLRFVHLEYLDDHFPEEERLLWEREPCGHRQLLEPHALPDPARPPMAPAEFDALLRAARWTALSPYLDPDGAGDSAAGRPPASPLHGGVRVEDYQLAPLRKALRMPRVNLLIADDVGLGKTVEAGLILTELLLRRRIRRVLILTPASLRNQSRARCPAPRHRQPLLSLGSPRWCPTPQGTKREVPRDNAPGCRRGVSRLLPPRRCGRGHPFRRGPTAVPTHGW